jgi:TonB family protein
MARAWWELLAACVSAFAMTTSAQEPATTSVVLVQIAARDARYPPIAESARVIGKVTVRVAVRPDGSVAEVTVFPQADGSWNLLHAAAADAAARATFECRGCTQPLTPHTLTVDYILQADASGNPPPAWRQTGNASSEVTVFGRSLVICCGPPSKPFHVRAARCLWLWRCSAQAYASPIE